MDGMNAATITTMATAERNAALVFKSPLLQCSDSDVYRSLESAEALPQEYAADKPKAVHVRPCGVISASFRPLFR
jgi:hypothetical protein